MLVSSRIVNCCYKTRSWTSEVTQIYPHWYCAAAAELEAVTVKHQKQNSNSVI